MADEIDIANIRAQESLDRAMRRQHDAAQPDAEQLRNSRGRIVCIDCEHPIPPARLRAYPNAVRCVYCQQDYEDMNRRTYHV